MWKDFDLSMISTDMDAAIWVPDEEDAIFLIRELYSHGIKWCGSSTKDNTNWGLHKSETCYFVESGRISYATREYAENVAHDHDGLFVFNGSFECEMSPVSEKEILQMLS